MPPNPIPPVGPPASPAHPSGSANIALGRQLQQLWPGMPRPASSCAVELVAVRSSLPTHTLPSLSPLFLSFRLPIRHGEGAPSVLPQRRDAAGLPLLGWRRMTSCVAGKACCCSMLPLLPVKACVALRTSTCAHTRICLAFRAAGAAAEPAQPLLGSMALRVFHRPL